LYFLYQNGEFLCIPGDIHWHCNCKPLQEKTLKGTLVKRTGVRTPWTPPRSASGSVLSYSASIAYILINNRIIITRQLLLLLSRFVSEKYGRRFMLAGCVRLARWLCGRLTIGAEQYDPRQQGRRPHTCRQSSQGVPTSLLVHRDILALFARFRGSFISVTVTGLFVPWTIRAVAGLLEDEYFYHLWRANSGQKPHKKSNCCYSRERINVLLLQHCSSFSVNQFDIMVTWLRGWTKKSNYILNVVMFFSIKLIKLLNSGLWSRNEAQEISTSTPTSYMYLWIIQKNRLRKCHITLLL